MLRHHDKGRSHLTPKQLVCRVNAFDIESFAIDAVPDSPARLKLNNVLTSHTPQESVSPPSRVSTAVGFRRKAPARRCAAKRALRGVEAQRARGRFPVALFPVKVAREASQPAAYRKRGGPRGRGVRQRKSSENARAREREGERALIHTPTWSSPLPPNRTRLGPSRSLFAPCSAGRGGGRCRSPHPPR